MKLISVIKLGLQRVTTAKNPWEKIHLVLDHFTFILLIITVVLMMGDINQ